MCLRRLWDAVMVLGETQETDSHASGMRYQTRALSLGEASAGSGPPSLDVLLSQRRLDAEGGDYSGQMTASEMGRTTRPGLRDAHRAAPDHRLPFSRPTCRAQVVLALGEDAAQPAPAVRRCATGILAP
jgi:hypothetical protein